MAQSQKMQAVGQLAGGIAHDFNNLLTAMIGFCDLLLVRHRAGDQSFADIMQIKQNANRAANLVRQLLAFSRQQTLQPRVLNITDVLAELSHLLRRLIGENIELKMTHGRDLSPVKVDHGQLEQVIINLAVNARDAMIGGGTLTIRTENVATAQPMTRGSEIMPPGNYVMVQVIDTGHRHSAGASSTASSSRSSPPRKSAPAPASGCRRSMASSSRPAASSSWTSKPKQGATFSIYLPRHVPDAASPEPVIAENMAEAVQTADLTGIGTVLLVEDEDAVRLFGARALRNKGYKVLEARSGEAALEIINSAAANKQPIDLLITDVVMPRMDGPTLIKASALEAADHEGHLHLGLCRGRVPQAPGRKRRHPFPAQALHAEAARRQGEGSPARGQRLAPHRCRGAGRRSVPLTIATATSPNHPLDASAIASHS